MLTPPTATGLSPGREQIPSGNSLLSQTEASIHGAKTSKDLPSILNSSIIKIIFRFGCRRENQDMGYRTTVWLHRTWDCTAAESTQGLSVSVKGHMQTYARRATLDAYCRSSLKRPVPAKPEHKRLT